MKQKFVKFYDELNRYRPVEASMMQATNDTKDKTYMVSPVDGKIYWIRDFKGQFILVKDKSFNVKLNARGKPTNRITMLAYATDKLTPRQICGVIHINGAYRTITQRSLNSVVTQVASSFITCDPAYPGTEISMDDFKAQIEAMPETRPTDIKVLPDLYRIFEENMDTLRGSTTSIYSGKTLKTGPCVASTAYDIIIARNEKVFPDIETPIAVGCLPKYGQLTSSGEIRKVYPMSISLQYVLSTYFTNKKYEPTKPYIKRVYGPNFPKHQYTYDISGMDKFIYDYLYKYAEKNDLLDIFLPPVLADDTVRYPRQMPSGITPTSEIGHAFTDAICQATRLTHEALGFPEINFWIQGDGIMTDIPINKDILYHTPIPIRKEPPFTINGFSYRKGFAAYARAKAKLTSPRIIHQNLDIAAAVYKKKVRQAIYVLVLKADEYEDIKVPSQFKGMSIAEITNIARQHQVCNRLLRYYNGYSSNNTSWDSTPTENVNVTGAETLPWSTAFYLDRW